LVGREDEVNQPFFWLAKFWQKAKKLNEFFRNLSYFWAFQQQFGGGKGKKSYYYICFSQ
jgi:hypothetical protein